MQGLEPRLTSICVARQAPSGWAPVACPASESDGLFHRTVCPTGQYGPKIAGIRKPAQVSVGTFQHIEHVMLEGAFSASSTFSAEGAFQHLRIFYSAFRIRYPSRHQAILMITEGVIIVYTTILDPSRGPPPGRYHIYDAHCST